jgi:hypothetical protein
VKEQFIANMKEQYEECVNEVSDFESKVLESLKIKIPLVKM